MPIEIEPVAYVRGGRSEVRDDFWGRESTVVELRPDLPAESLDGIERHAQRVRRRNTIIIIVRQEQRRALSCDESILFQCLSRTAAAILI